MRSIQEGPGPAYQRVYGVLDPDSLEGQQRVAQTIKDYWAKRGHVVTTTIMPAKTARGEGGRRLWNVRSDMRDGYPRGLLALTLNHAVKEPEHVGS